MLGKGWFRVQGKVLRSFAPHVLHEQRRTEPGLARLGREGEALGAAGCGNRPRHCPRFSISTDFQALIKDFGGRASAMSRICSTSGAPAYSPRADACRGSPIKTQTRRTPHQLGVAYGVVSMVEEKVEGGCLEQRERRSVAPRVEEEGLHKVHGVVCRFGDLAGADLVILEPAPTTRISVRRKHASAGAASAAAAWSMAARATSEQSAKRMLGVCPHPGLLSRLKDDSHSNLILPPPGLHHGHLHRRSSKPLLRGASRKL